MKTLFAESAESSVCGWLEMIFKSDDVLRTWLATAVPLCPENRHPIGRCYVAKLIRLYRGTGARNTTANSTRRDCGLTARLS